MADREWLKNLAEARYERGRWLVKSDSDVKKLAAARIDEAITALYEGALTAAEIYNEYARGKRQVRVLEAAPQKDEPAGFLLLMGRSQILTKPEHHMLVSTLVTVTGFTRHSRELMRLRAHVDAFGSVVWSREGQGALLMTNELIIKRLLEDLSIASYESPDVGPDKG